MASAASTASPLTASPYTELAIGYLFPSPLNPRKHFDEMGDLAENIRKQGVLVPLLVRFHEDRTVPYEIVDGERRYRAAKEAGLDSLPAIVRTLADDEVLEIQLLSAIQRQSLTPLEEARGYRRLIDSNKAKYSAAYIADRIGRSEKYVVDRMRLLQLVPALQQLLDDERIGVAHAELLAKLKPEDQQRASSGGDVSKWGREGDPGGLWARVARTLEFDGDESDERATKTDPYAGLKPVTVKELEAWIARHVRFDVEHFAATAPLEFGGTAIAVEAAMQEPGRGRKVVSITEDYRPDDAVRKDGGERIYSQRSWKRADGTKGTARGGRYGEKRIDAATCEHSVLGVVVTGPGYGTSFQVCIARDRCKVHWATEIKAREKAADAKAAPSSAAKAKKTEETWQERQRREDAERARLTAAYQLVYPQIADAIETRVPSAFDATIFAFVWARFDRGKVPSVTPDQFMRELVMHQVRHLKPNPKYTYGTDRNLSDVLDIATHFGVDVKPFRKAYSEHVSAAKKDAASKAKAKAKSERVPAAKKATKKPKAGKAAKKR